MSIVKANYLVFCNAVFTKYLLILLTTFGEQCWDPRSDNIALQSGFPSQVKIPNKMYIVTFCNETGISG